MPDVKGKVDVQVRDHRDAAVGGAVKAGGAVRGAADGAAGVGANVKGQVKAPDVKIKVKAPEVKVKGEAKGSFKLGK